MLAIMLQFLYAHLHMHYKHAIYNHVADNMRKAHDCVIISKMLLGSKMPNIYRHYFWCENMHCTQESLLLGSKWHIPRMAKVLTTR